LSSDIAYALCLKLSQGQCVILDAPICPGFLVKFEYAKQVILGTDGQVILPTLDERSCARFLSDIADAKQVILSTVEQVILPTLASDPTDACK